MNEWMNEITRKITHLAIRLSEKFNNIVQG